MTTAVVVVLLVVLLVAALRLWSTANRLDRLHVRTEAAWSALEGALARRVVATRAVAAAGGLDHAQAEELRRLADTADTADRRHRADAENDLSRALSAVPPASEPVLDAELADAAERVVLARRFYNDAVRDTRALRAVWFTRVFGLAGRAAMPDYFEIVEYPQRSLPLRRTAARVVLVDDSGRVLLLSGTDPQVGSRWWITPGGGIENDEDLAATAVRELAEETGIRLSPADLVGPIWRRVARFVFTGIDYEQTEFYFVARAPGRSGAETATESGGGLPDRPVQVSGRESMTDTGRASTMTDPTGEAATSGRTLVATRPTDSPADPPLDVSGHTDEEKLTLTGHRWWTAAALAGTDEAIYPNELSARLEAAQTVLLSGVAPDQVPDVN